MSLERYNELIQITIECFNKYNINKLGRNDHVEEFLTV